MADLSSEAQAVLDGAGALPWGVSSNFPNIIIGDGVTYSVANGHAEAIVYAVNNIARVERERAALRAERDEAREWAAVNARQCDEARAERNAAVARADALQHVLDALTPPRPGVSDAK